MFYFAFCSICTIFALIRVRSLAAPQQLKKHFIAFGLHRLCHQKSTETHFNDVYGHHSSWHATQRHDDY